MTRHVENFVPYTWRCIKHDLQKIIETSVQNVDLFMHVSYQAGYFN